MKIDLYRDLGKEGTVPKPCRLRKHELLRREEMLLLLLLFLHLNKLLLAHPLFVLLLLLCLLLLKLEHLLLAEEFGLSSLLFCLSLLLVRVEGCELGLHRCELWLHSVLGLQANSVRGWVDEWERIVAGSGTRR